jgi:hypothetical protein
MVEMQIKSIAGLFRPEGGTQVAFLKQNNIGIFIFKFFSFFYKTLDFYILKNYKIFIRSPILVRNVDVWWI